MQDDQQPTNDNPAPLPNDGATPAAPPDDVNGGGMPTDHPDTDTDMDSHETYDAGTEAAAGGADANQPSDNQKEEQDAANDMTSGLGDEDLKDDQN